MKALQRIKAIRARILDRLGFRMALSLAVILLPLAIVSILRSQAAIAQTEERNRAALFGETVQMAGAELALIDSARGVAKSVSALIVDLLDEPGLCDAAVSRIAERANLSFVGFIATDGSVPCSSVDSPPNFAGTPELEAALENPQETVRRTSFGPASEAPVVYIVNPVFSGPDQLSGFVTVSILQSLILDSRETSIEGTEFLTMNIDGEVLTSSLPLERAVEFLPSAGFPKVLLREGGTFKARSERGEDTFFAVSPVVAGEIAMIGLWTDRSARALDFYLERASFFPLVMWLASLVVGWFMVDYLVTRHVKSLASAMGSFATARRAEMPKSFDAAPVELREVGEAYIDLTDNVLRDEAKLEDAVYQKNILLREVHHRVKNNLQLIASIMSMQMRRTESKEVKEVMTVLQDRVLALATIHKSLYQTSGLASIRLDELLNDIVGQLMSLSRGSGDVKLDSSYDPVSLLPDQAVPFSLLVTEAMTNALKYMSAEVGAQMVLRINLRDLGDERVSLVIENSRGGPDWEKSDPHSTGLGAQLMMAFATQLGTEMKVDATETHYRLSLEFASAPLDEVTPSA